MDFVTLLVIGLIMALGVFGALTQLFPGSLLILLGTLLWAALTGGNAWWYFGGVAAIVVIAWLLLFLIPYKNMRNAGIPFSTLVIGFLLAIPGFFIIPIIGMPLGFLLGVFLATKMREKDKGRDAWQDTWTATKGVLVAALIEVTCCAIAIAVWIVGVVQLYSVAA